MAINATLRKQLLDGLGVSDADAKALTEAQVIQVSVALNLKALAAFTKNGLQVTEITTPEAPS